MAVKAKGFRSHTSFSCAYATAFRHTWMPSPSSGSGLFLRRYSSFNCPKCGWLVIWLNASGWGINPKTRPVSSQMPAIASTEPFGLSGNCCVGLPNRSTYCMLHARSSKPVKDRFVRRYEFSLAVPDRQVNMIDALREDAGRIVDLS